MEIKEIKIQNFKSFGPNETIISNLGKLNIFIGKNNSGKSNILKALNTIFSGFKTKGGRINHGQSTTGLDENYWFQRKTEEATEPIPLIIKVALILDYNDFKFLFEKYTNNERKNIYIATNINDRVEVTLEILPNYEGNSASSKIKAVRIGDGYIYNDVEGKVRFLNISNGATMGGDDFSFLNNLIKLLHTNFKLVDAIKIPDIQVATEFDKFENDLTLRKEHIPQKVNKFLKILFPNTSNVSAYDYFNGKEIHLQEEIKLPMSSYGDGIGQIFMIFYEVYKKNAKIVAIEEPESHLHPHLYRKLIEVLKEITKEEGTQFFIVTHSAVSIVPEDVHNLYRCEYTPKGGTKVYNLLEQIDLRRLAQELNPDSSEMFFADNVILVEGPEDKFFIQGLLNKLSLNENEIKLISCGSKDNFKIYKDILSPFKIPHAIVCDKNSLTPENSINVIKELLKDKGITDMNKQIEFLRTKNIWVLSENDISGYYPNRFSSIPKAPKRALKVLNELKKEDFDLPKFKELSGILEKIVKL